MTAGEGLPHRADPAGLSPRRIPRLLAITDLAAGAPGGRLEDWLLGLAEAGIDALQVREKALADRDLFALVGRVRAVLPSHVTVIVNGRADVALAAGADGVHLPAAGLPAEAIRQLARGAHRTLLIGRSTHHPDEVRAAHRDGVDYVSFGPVYPTPSKRRYGPPPGLVGLREAARAGLPVLALGGVTPGALVELAAAGAAGAAGIRVFGDLSGAREMAAAAGVAWGPLDRSPGGEW